MKNAEDPPRLADTSLSGAVLGAGIAAARERGPSEAQMRALREGVFAGIGITAIAASSGLASGGAKAGGLVAHGWWTAAVTKVALAVVVGGAVTGGTVAAWREHRRASVAVRTVRPATGPTGAVPPPPAPTSPGGVQLRAPTPAAEPLERLAIAPAPAIASRGNVPPRARDERRTASAFAAELELLGRARAALGHDPAAALALTTRHGRLFPGGLLEQERDVLVIEALVALDRRDEAADRARSFWRRYPQSPYADKVRRTLSDTVFNSGAANHK